jgi:CO/xanthine dehydrogenase FAD-binding subunit
MSKFLTFERYCAPETEEGLFRLLRDETACVMAGGTDLLIAIREKGLRPSCVVDIKRIIELRGIQRLNGGGLSVGATTTLHEIETNRTVREICPVLGDAVGMIGSLQVRNRGTIGGNLSNASPAADSAPALLVLDAQLELVSASGTRVIPAEAFFVGPGKCVLKQGEILKGIRIPQPASHTQSAYLKFGPRKAMDIAVVGVAVSLKFEGDGSCREARLALGSVAPTPVRVKKAEAALLGELNEQRIQAAAGLAVAETSPVDDVRGGKAYRAHLVRVLAIRAIKQAIAQHRGAKSP